MHPNRFLKQDVLSELFPPDEPGSRGEVSAGAPKLEDQAGKPVKVYTPGPPVQAVEAAQGPEPMEPVPVAAVAAEEALDAVLGAEREVSTAMALGRVVAIVNQKGGVGKTTSAINLGAALSEEGARVLLVDFDPQGALSVGLGLNPSSLDLTVYNLLLDRDVSFDEVVTPTKVEGLDLIPSNIDLSAAEVVLVSEVAREQMLKRCLAPAQSFYNYILIDCPPSLGLLTVNALTAAHAVVIPLECEYFALRGMALLMDTIGKVQERLNPGLEVLGILATMLESRTIHGREVLGRVTDAFGDKLFKTVIHKTIKFAESPVAGEPILSYAPSSNGAIEYRELAREVLARDA
ncbi:MAG TPA: ParA family protein [Actinomycetota bacterium]|nr:ParA family protein [Actinomycetota bacterium]